MNLPLKRSRIEIGELNRTRKTAIMVLSPILLLAIALYKHHIVFLISVVLEALLIIGVVVALIGFSFQFAHHIFQVHVGLLRRLPSKNTILLIPRRTLICDIQIAQGRIGLFFGTVDLGEMALLIGTISLLLTIILQIGLRSESINTVLDVNVRVLRVLCYSTILAVNRVHLVVDHLGVAPIVNLIRLIVSLHVRYFLDRVIFFVFGDFELV